MEALRTHNCDMAFILMILKLVIYMSVNSVNNDQAQSNSTVRRNIHRKFKPPALSHINTGYRDGYTNF